MDTWTVITILGLTSPLILLWGWVRYFRFPTRSDWRSRASLIGLAAPVLSLVVWGIMLLLARGNGWHTSSPAVDHATTLGVWIPIVGMLVGLTGRPILILAIVPSSIGTVLFWYSTTLP
jgi:hypothetical protein